MDDRTSCTDIYYSDNTLGWLVKRSSLCLGCDKKYFRVVHNSKSLFLSSSRKTTLLDLGFHDGDTVEIGGVGRAKEDRPRESLEKAAKTEHPSHKTNKNAKGPKTKNRSGRTPSAPSGQNLAAQHKQEHSKSMNPVLEELSPKLKRIRNRLQSLTIRKTAPKVRCHETKAVNTTRAAPIFLFADESNVKKAGKAAYAILVGEVSNHHKTSKLPHKKSDHRGLARTFKRRGSGEAGHELAHLGGYCHERRRSLGRGCRHHLRRRRPNSFGCGKGVDPCQSASCQSAKGLDLICKREPSRTSSS